MSFTEMLKKVPLMEDAPVYYMQLSTMDEASLQHKLDNIPPFPECVMSMPHDTFYIYMKNHRTGASHFCHFHEVYSSKKHYVHMQILTEELDFDKYSFAACVFDCSTNKIEMTGFYFLHKNKYISDEEILQSNEILQSVIKVPVGIKNTLNSVANDVKCRMVRQSNWAGHFRQDSFASNHENYGNFLEDIEETCIVRFRVNLGFLVSKSREKDYVFSSEKKRYKKYPDKKGKKAYAETDVTYISSKKYLTSGEAPASLRNKNWTHSWIKRGHWRKISEDSIKPGKDRNGNRNQEGRTWVVEAQPNRDLPLKNKIRIVKN